MKTRESIANTQKALNGHDHHHNQEFLLIKQDDKFFSRLLSKETSSESSFRFFYYGDSSKGSIPFRWESQPGTPKHALCDASLPPLTPPPSYQTSAELTSHSSRRRRFSGAKCSLPSFLFSKLSSKKTKDNNISPSSLSSSSCSSSFSLSSSTSTAALTRRRHRSTPDFQLRLEEIYGDEDDHDTKKNFPTCRSWLCWNNIKVLN